MKVAVGLGRGVEVDVSVIVALGDWAGGGAAGIEDPHAMRNRDIATKTRNRKRYFIPVLFGCIDDVNILATDKRDGITIW
jgi:hypothetical protein